MKKQNGRVCFIEADHDILKSIEDYKRISESGKRVKVPEKITECIDCPKNVSVDLRPLDEDEAQEFRNLIDKVSNIYTEDTVNVIQNRAQTYMNESS